MRITQPMLDQRVDVLTHNGRLEPARPVLEKVGYGANTLDEGRKLLEAWRREHDWTRELLNLKKKATRAKNTARRNAKKELNSLANTIRIVFARSQEKLRLFQLDARYTWMDGKKRRVRPTETLEDHLDRWNNILEGVHALEPTDRGKLEEAGWPPSRVEDAAQLVITSSDLDLEAHRARTVSRTQTRVSTELEIKLREWYSRASALIRLAIDELPREQQAPLTDFLELHTAKAPGER